MIHESIQGKIKGAMLAKDAVRLETLRGMSAAFVNELVAKGRKPDEKLSDEEALAVVMRLAKQRKDSIEQFKKGGREDLVAEETAEVGDVISKAGEAVMSLLCEGSQRAMERFNRAP